MDLLTQTGSGLVNVPRRNPLTRTMSENRQRPTIESVWFCGSRTVQYRHDQDIYQPFIVVACMMSTDRHHVITSPASSVTRKRLKSISQMGCSRYGS